MQPKFFHFITSITLTNLGIGVDTLTYERPSIILFSPSPHQVFKGFFTDLCLVVDGVRERRQGATTSTSVLRGLLGAVSTALNEHLRALRQLSQSKLSLKLGLHF